MRKRASTGRRSWIALHRASTVLLAGALALAGCAGSPEPRLPATAAEVPAAPRVPVVLVPGVSGTELVERASGEVLWGTGARVLFPHDGGYGIALPLVPFDPLGVAGAAVPRVVAGGVIEEIHLAGLVRKPVYGPVLAALETAGYRRGDLDRPRAGDTLFAFAYDWRQDDVVSARLLREKLEALGRARGESPLAVDLVCQSNGAHVCRYLLKYGGASLDDAEAGRAGPPATLTVRRLVLVGSSNGGSLRILRELDRGRRYVPLVGRKIQPETLFTVRSLFADLPAYRDDLFLDEAGRPLDVDLYDPASWRRYGWSVFAAEARRRLDRAGRPDLFATPDGRLAYLREVLGRARRFQALLARDVAGFGPTRFYLIQNVSADTPDRAVLVHAGKRWRTWFTGDPRLERRPALRALATAPGDGHATRASQLWLAPQELAAMAGEPFAVHGGHFELILEPEALSRLVEVVTAPDGPPAAAPPR